MGRIHGGVSHLDFSDSILNFRAEVNWRTRPGLFGVILSPRPSATMRGMTRYSTKKLLVAVALMGIGAELVVWLNRGNLWTGNNVAILNQLRDEINANYGYKEGTPRVNCGPCIRFAIAFHDRWNARFRAQAKFACFVASSLCGHVAIKLPNHSFFDGGNGVMSEQKLATMFSDCTIEEMTELDMKLFNQRDVELLQQSIGSQTSSHYVYCPNYLDELTALLIDKYLAMLTND
jgi:hypothetical protein